MMNRQQFDITNDGREHKIIEHIRRNQGCTKANITRELQGIISKKTIYKIVEQKINDKIIEAKKEKQNSRDVKMYIKEENPAVFVPLQLEEIERAFHKLLTKSERKWQELQECIAKEWKTSKFDVYVGSLIGADSLLYFGPAMILKLLIDSIVLHTTTTWASKDGDNSNLNKLFTEVFKKLGSLNIRYIDYLNYIRYKDIANSQFDNEALIHALSSVQLMYMSRRLYEEIGIQEEIADMLNSLWEFNKDIQDFIFPEMKLYKWNSKYDISNWKNLLEVYEKNMNQTAFNYYFGKNGNRSIQNRWKKEM